MLFTVMILHWMTVGKFLRNHDAWKNFKRPAFITKSRKKPKSLETTSGSTKGHLNFQNVDDSDEEEETRESRPQGRDAE